MFGVIDGSVGFAETRGDQFRFSVGPKCHTNLAAEYVTNSTIWYWSRRPITLRPSLCGHKLPWVRDPVWRSSTCTPARKASAIVPKTAASPRC